MGENEILLENNRKWLHTMAKPDNNADVRLEAFNFALLR